MPDDDSSPEDADAAADEVDPDEAEPVTGRAPSPPGPEADLASRAAANPLRSALLGAAVVFVVAYAVLVQAQLLVAIWLVVVGFVVWLLLRFVRAHERLAAAAERLAAREE